ncbi:MAG: hypothetical protein QOH24_667 [Verrucomicrobiota bacterium]|jgi:hypothetical protein
MSATQGQDGRMPPGKIAIAELVVAACLSLTLLVLLFVRATHGGALWRDECGALHLAQLSSFSEIARNFQHEAFPLLFPTTLRLYSHIFGTSDAALRFFGFVVGVGFVAATWFVMPPKERPLLQLGLVGLNTTFLVWGTTVRGYGLGSVLILITLGSAVRTLRHPTFLNLLITSCAAIASAHCLLHNLTLIAAMTIAAVFALSTSGRGKDALMVCVAALGCALTMLPYAPGYLAADWRMVLRVPIGLGWLWQQFLIAMGEPWWLMRPLWLGAAVLLVVSAIVQLRSRKQSQSKDAVVSFLFFFCVIALITYFGFLRLLSYATHSWYYLALLTVLAAAIDLFVVFTGGKWLRIARLIIAVAAYCAIPFGLLGAITQRQSNIDDVARKLNDARAGDLIVLNPWFLALSFNHYYRGTAPWLTAPRIPETRFHRFDLVKSKMSEPEPLADVEEEVRKTLVSGHRVWLAGGALIPPDGRIPVNLKPAPDPEFGWNTDAYTTAWSQQIGTFFQAHSLSAAVVLAPENQVNSYENIPLWVAEGWKE